MKTKNEYIDRQKLTGLTSNSKVAHAYTYAEKHEFGGTANFYFRDDVIYSYGSHFPIAKKVRSKSGEIVHVLFTESSYSISTSKHISMAQQAIRQHEQIFCITDIDFFDALKECKAQLQNMIEVTPKIARARAEWKIDDYTRQVLSSLGTIRTVAKYYKISSKLPKYIKELLKLDSADVITSMQGVAAKSEAAKKREEAKLAKARAKRQAKQMQDLKVGIDEWKSGTKASIDTGFIGLDFLRLSADGLEIETTQQISIPSQEFTRLIKLYDAGKIVGAKVADNYTVLASNGTVKIGCHNIPKEEILEIRNKLNC